MQLCVIEFTWLRWTWQWNCTWLNIVLLNNVIICIMYSCNWSKRHIDRWSTEHLAPLLPMALVISGAIGSHQRHCKCINGTTHVLLDGVTNSKSICYQCRFCHQWRHWPNRYWRAMCNMDVHVSLTPLMVRQMLHSTFYLTLLPLILNTLASTTSSLRTQFTIKITIELSCRTADLL